MVEPPLTPDVAEAVAQGRRDKRRKWRMFGVSLAVRLLGLALIWLGDGSPTIFRKAVVVLGVILSVGGIPILRYLLTSGFDRKNETLIKTPAPSGSRTAASNFASL